MVEKFTTHAEKAMSNVGCFSCLKVLFLWSTKTSFLVIMTFLVLGQTFLAFYNYSTTLPHDSALMT